MTVRNLIVVLGDQLSVGLSSLAAGDPNKDLVLLMEVQDEATYVRHHKKKIAFIFSAMRHFAEALREAGWTVDYVRLEAPGNTGSFAGEVERAIGRHNPERFIITEPGEWRVRDAMQRWSGDFQIDVQVVDDDRFICSHTEFKS
jgi:deoxyribodipyrimidine photolyase-related protein